MPSVSSGRHFSFFPSPSPFSLALSPHSMCDRGGRGWGAWVRLPPWSHFLSRLLLPPAVLRQGPRTTSWQTAADPSRPGGACAIRWSSCPTPACVVWPVAPAFRSTPCVWWCGVPLLCVMSPFASSSLPSSPSPRTTRPQDGAPRAVTDPSLIIFGAASATRADRPPPLSSDCATPSPPPCTDTRLTLRCSCLPSAHTRA